VGVASSIRCSGLASSVRGPIGQGRRGERGSGRHDGSA